MKQLQLSVIEEDLLSFQLVIYDKEIQSFINHFCILLLYREDCLLWGCPYMWLHFGRTL